MPLDKLTLKLILRLTPFYPVFQRRWEKEQTARWFREGSPIPPPPSRKRQVLREYGRRYGLAVLVETGIYLGDTLSSLRDDYEQLYSIELSERLFRAAQRRFAGSAKIHLLQGDSGERIRDILAKLDRPALFWLDGHYSGGDTAAGSENTPINAELSAIAAHYIKNHVILIDDARCFGRDEGYPGLSQLEALAKEKFPGFNFEVSEDLIRLTPPPSGVPLGSSLIASGTV